MTQFIIQSFRALHRISTNSCALIISSIKIISTIRFTGLEGTAVIKGRPVVYEKLDSWERVCAENCGVCLCACSCVNNLLFQARILFCLSMLPWDQTTAMHSTCSYFWREFNSASYPTYQRQGTFNNNVPQTTAIPSGLLGRFQGDGIDLYKPSLLEPSLHTRLHSSNWERFKLQVFWDIALIV